MRSPRPAGRPGRLRGRPASTRSRDEQRPSPPACRTRSTSSETSPRTCSMRETRAPVPRPPLPARDAHALVVAQQVRRGVEAGLVAGAGKNALQHRAHGAFAVGAGHGDDREAGSGRDGRARAARDRVPCRWPKDGCARGSDQSQPRNSGLDGAQFTAAQHREDIGHVSVAASSLRPSEPAPSW